jgi:hypothetical protein
MENQLEMKVGKNHNFLRNYVLQQASDTLGICPTIKVLYIS